jgi:hypothetical protein
MCQRVFSLQLILSPLRTKFSSHSPSRLRSISKLKKLIWGKKILKMPRQVPQGNRFCCAGGNALHAMFQAISGAKSTLINSDVAPVLEKRLRFDHYKRSYEECLEFAKKERVQRDWSTMHEAWERYTVRRSFSTCTYRNHNVHFTRTQEEFSARERNIWSIIPTSFQYEKSYIDWECEERDGRIA